MRQELDETGRRIVAVLLASPRASWREVGRVLGLSERTVVRRAAPLYADGTLCATAVRNPSYFPDLVPIALRIRCRPSRIRQVAQALARRSDTVWVDILGGGDEISAVFFLDGPEARNTLLLRDLPATDAVHSWTAHTLLRVFPTAFRWTAGLLSSEETARLAPAQPTARPAPLDIDNALTAALTEDGRASYTELARRAGTTALTARRRLDALVRGQVVRLATEVDLALLGVHAEALLWITAQPGALARTAENLAAHPQVRFAAATTGPANLLVAVAATDLDALYAFLVTTVGPLSGINTVDTTPLLATAKRTGLARRSAHVHR
ncbi:DNA-binding Lrp family transcriptional regulator [Streptomyces griseochromogenes]|uniref:AsnC family transcriptional regulator n=1 Tax=Streptomyces griseochromogenes TaxID=68214 RepID=A0A1B1BDG0_9ACTN|nr:Lrp/AsnC family transcriptional regulator [Streptomyces griseochromogenes]ANP56772.1 AsnC family transcriptional regulator [Streptomyces griseochromogenes]MBP2055930.1 DNA-binding Lrp family transcriptional regulator [Streptomyces griseochromogenes]